MMERSSGLSSASVGVGSSLTSSRPALTLFKKMRRRGRGRFLTVRRPAMLMMTRLLVPDWCSTAFDVCASVPD
jgi:hypothetical protein